MVNADASKPDSGRTGADPALVAATLPGLLKRWRRDHPDRIWLSEREGGGIRIWTWAEAAQEALAIGAWLEERLGGRGKRVAILSRNCAHWMLADLAITAAGHVTVPIFTTQSADIARYILDFAEVDILILGAAENQEKVRAVLPDRVAAMRLPGARAIAAAFDWDDIAGAYRGREPAHVPDADDLASIIFTSGTTGLPKGVMHTHRSLVVPMIRAREPLRMPMFPRFISYLPLSHLAEREQIFVMSLLQGGSVRFLERRETLLRDLRETRPTFFFGAPRIWEQLQHAILLEFGGPDAFAAALADDPAETARRARRFLGFDDVDFLLSGSAPISSALLAFYARIGLVILEGFGQTEAMGVMCNSMEERRLGSIGKPVSGVEAKLSAEGELLIRAEGFSPGYFKDPEQTARTFVDGWVHTGDRARVDADGFYYITGRIKEYFKTIHGKFVAPVPLEDAFAGLPEIDQLCLLGRGYSKTVMVCTLSPAGRTADREGLAAALKARAAAVNAGAEKHAHLGGVIVSLREWTIDNGFLTTTLKIKRDSVETEYGERARELAREAAERKQILVECLA
ncbi:AMP-binding protein [Methylobacterium sp. ID0610]|uniref:AMP-binding protein n=1 Tax=Methylobacterium carpenticola TaxID=3344827 RepID=UPI00368D1560